MSSGLYQIRDKNLDTTLDLSRLKPYGDTMNDGKVQLSFTLPVRNDDRGAAAAVLLAQKMGLADPNVALRQALDETFTFYVVYGALTHTVNYNEIVVQTVTDETMDMHETDEFLRERLGRRLVVVGASTGTDAHTVGIDAIMNRKGFAGHYGLERYEMVDAYNLGSQVPNEVFLQKAAEVKADVLLRLPDGHPEGCPHPEPHRAHRAGRGRGGPRAVHHMLRRRPHHPCSGQRTGVRRRLRGRHLCRRRSHFLRQGVGPAAGEVGRPPEPLRTENHMQAGPDS